jgi:hypothetical protein
VPDRLFQRHGGWRSEKARNNYVYESLDSLLPVQSRLRMDIDIAFDSMLFMPTACFLELSWKFKELNLIVTYLLCHRNSLLYTYNVYYALIFLYSAPFALYSCVVQLGMAPSCMWEVWFSAGWGTNETENLFLTHGWESEYKCIGGFSSRGLYKVQFSFCHPPLPDMPHWTREVFLESIKLKWIYSLATFLCCCKTVVVMLIKVRLRGSAWHGSQLCVRRYCFVYIRDVFTLNSSKSRWRWWSTSIFSR